MVTELLQRCGATLALAFAVLATVMASASTTALLRGLRGGLAPDEAQGTARLLAQCGALAGTLGFIGTVAYSRGVLVGLEAISGRNGSTAEMLAGFRDLSGALNTTLIGMALQIAGMSLGVLLIQLARRGAA